VPLSCRSFSGAQFLPQSGDVAASAAGTRFATSESWGHFPAPVVSTEESSMKRSFSSVAVAVTGKVTAIDSTIRALFPGWRLR